MTTVTAPAARAQGVQVWSQRLAAVFPLVTLYVCFAFLYSWQGWTQSAPWIFYDELLYTHVSQQVTGGAQMTLDYGSPLRALYGVLIAPAWLFSDVESAYATAKYIGALTMSLTVFPAYALARTVAPRYLALFAAAAATAIPSLKYTSALMEEVLAYPYATLTFFLIVKALADRSRGWIAGAVAACLLAPLVRGQLILLPLLFAAAAGLVYASERWGEWSRRQRLVAVAIALAITVVTALVGYQVYGEAHSVVDNPARFADRAVWAAGVFAIGLGILPVVAGLASVARPRGEKWTPATRAFVCLLLPAAIAFPAYAGVKGAWADWVNPILERNLIYLAPLLLTGTALVLARARVRWPAVALSAGLVLAAVLAVPVELRGEPAPEGPTIAILAAARDGFGWSMTELRWAFVGAWALGLVLLGVVVAVRHRRRTLAAVTAALAIAVVGWSITAEIYASDAGADYAERLMLTVPEPNDWVDRLTGGDPAASLSRLLVQPSDIWLLGFWNPSLQQYLSFDRTPPGSGFSGTAVVEMDGTIFADPRLRYLLAEPGIGVAGRRIATVNGLTLYRVARPRLDTMVYGVYKDGWMVDTASFDYFKRSTPGTVSVTMSRGVLCGPDTPRSTATVTVSRLVPGPPDGRPAAGPVVATRTGVLHDCDPEIVRVPTPAPPFRTTVRVSPTVVPYEIDTRIDDHRRLGAQVGFTFEPSDPSS